MASHYKTHRHQYLKKIFRNAKHHPSPITNTMMILRRTTLSAVLLIAFISSTDAFAPIISRSESPSTSTLLRSKSSDRAYIERNLEDMMGNDWREFRAKLVAQEQQREASLSTRPNGSAGHTRQLANQGHLGDRFAGEISSIFHYHKQQEKKNSWAIRDGNFYDDERSGGFLLSNDPFVSDAELPSFMQSTVSIDRHRWAHAIPHPEPGSVLIAHEKLGGVFHQAVILIIHHCDRTGSTGVVINRPLAGDSLNKAKSKLDLSLKLAFSSSPVTYGGPVLSDEYSIIHGFGPVEGSTKLCPGVYVGGSEELVNEVRIKRFDPRQCLFVQGHASWEPGQLSLEISDGVWTPAAVSADFILRYAGAPVTEADNTNDLWADILTCMGGDSAAIAQAYQGLGDMRMF